MIIRVISLKGGIGKSTISAFLAKYLSEEGNSKVLLIDKDNLKFSSFLNNILDAKVDINKEKLDGYDYIIIDYPTATEKIESKDDDIVILVSDVVTLDLITKYAKELKGIKVLIVNMVSPLPGDLEEVNNMVEKLDFDLKFVIPFIPKAFSMPIRKDKRTEIPAIRELAKLIKEKIKEVQVEKSFK